MWRMPLWRPYLRYLPSHVADIANGSSTRMAGSITAALYLERFVPARQPWAHMDVYAWNDSDRPGRPAGGEAQGPGGAYEMLKERGAAGDRKAVRERTGGCVRVVPGGGRLVTKKIDNTR